MSTVELNGNDLAALTCIHEGRNYRLHLQMESSYDRPVVIKSLLSAASKQMEGRLLNEYQQTKNLKLHGIRCAVGTLVVGGRPAIALDYVDATTLTDSYVKKRHSLKQNLEVAVAIAGVLNDIHRLHLIHRNLASEHILVTSEPVAVKLISFSDSSVKGEFGQDVADIETSMLDYISPEQSGRINRVVDQRSDLYSLGAVLYELFTGKPPFSAKDSAELVHAHIAKIPQPPVKKNPSLPKAITDLIMRLLAKNPDDRYQSAFGVMVDLETVLEQLKRTGRVGDLELAQEDYSSVFQLPDHIYGRDAEIIQLKTALRESVTGGVVLVSGRAGSGKSALVDAVRSYATDQGIYFVTGSYESSKRHESYTGLRQAFNQWIDLILTEDPELVARWKSELLEVCGSTVSLLIDMLPRLELVVDSQKPTTTLAPTQTQHMFHNLLRNFVSASARAEHPLILFLDNLQWADQASLHLMEILLSEAGPQPILFIAAYRDDEIGSQSYLNEIIESFITNEKKLTTISLEELSLDDVNILLADMLRMDSVTTMPLACIVIEKTGGNPLFVKQFIQSLYDKKLLVFDEEKRSWCWEVDTIKKREVIRSVAELMSEKIDDLPDETRDTLAIAACIGFRFAIEVLAAVVEQPVPEVVSRLQPAVNAGLLRRISMDTAPCRSVKPDTEDGCEFPHDRVRQAAYDLYPQKQQRLNHLCIARYLLSQTQENALEQCVFEIADQYNYGFEYLKSEEERHTLIKINLMAGRKARRSAAYLSSIRYLSMGIGLLPSDCWSSSSEPTLELYVEAVEAEYLSANYERAALLSKEILQHTSDLFVRQRVYELQILFLSAQGQIEEAVEAGLEALQGLGVVLTEELAVHEQHELSALTGKIKSLERLPTMSDPQHLASLRIMMQMAAPALRTNLHLLESVIGKMVLLSVAHGNSPMAAFAYGWYGAILCGNVGGVEAGYQFGKLSLAILRQFNSPELEPRVTLLFNAYVSHWKEPVRDSIFRLQEVFEWGLETGDFEYTSLGAVHHCGYLLFTGWPLEVVRRKQERYLETLEWWRLPFQSELLRIWIQTVTNLCGKENDPSRLIGKYFDETKYIPKWVEENNDLSMFCMLCSKTMLQYMFGDYRAAAVSGEEAESYERAALGLYYRANFSFYYSLTLLAINDQRGKGDVEAYLNLALTHINRLRRWSLLAPISFAHKLALVEAEQARARGNNGKAIERFNDAIRLVRKHDNVMDEALIYEREAHFYSALGREEIAEISLHNALDSYRSWGAYRKVEELERKFKPLIRHGAELIDTATILKASHSLSQEMHTDKLLEKLLRIAIENAGAEKGVLIEMYDDSLLVLARAVGNSVELLKACPVDKSGDVALSVVNYVVRTLNEVVIHDAVRDPIFGGDEYIVEHRVRSLICLPIIYQGKLSGLLYLENNLTSGVFTEDRLELLKALASQTAISMENALLYTELENNVFTLSEGEKRFREIFDHTFQFIGVLDINGVLLQANRTALQFAGVSEDEVIGKKFWDTPWWSHSAELQQQLKSAINKAKEGELVRFDATHISKDGKTSYVDFSVNPVKDGSKQISMLIVEGRDITEHK
jgi:PAS domain S-box-containing protein